MNIEYIFLTLLAVKIGANRIRENPPFEGSQSSPRVNDTRDRSFDKNNITNDGKKPHLRLTTKLIDLSLTSGERVQLKCRADSWPRDHMQFTWYKDSKIFEKDDNDEHVTIRNRGTTTKLTIKHLLTSDSGSYTCEVSNGFSTAISTAMLEVSFSLPPTDDTVTLSPFIPKGKCEIYRGTSCGSLLEGKEIYVDPFMSQAQMEQQISFAFSYIHTLGDFSADCQHYSFASFCNFVFSPCKTKLDLKSGEKKAFPVKLCREDCELMKNDVCSKEYKLRKDDIFLKKVIETADCSLLPAVSSTEKCTKVGLPSVVDDSHTCYNGSGVGYKGRMSITVDGRLCKSWPQDLVYQHKELSGGHPYCRNPGGINPKPWCYVEDGIQAECSLEECAQTTQNGVSFLMIMISSILILLLGCSLLFLFCFRRRKQIINKNNKHKEEAVSNKTIATLKKMNLPELTAGLLNYVKLYGECRFGKVYEAFVLPNPHISTAIPVIVKTLRINCKPEDIKEFKKEMQIFSELQHKNVTCLKAFILQPNLHAMVYEHSSEIDLHELLMRSSPQSDFSNISNLRSLGTLEQDFTQMSLQIASGMEYLTSNDFIHRDLAARNILVCGNMELKISNFGVVRNSYLSCYCRSPQDGQMLPIRWMAPESIHSWTFSDKSTVWSFGVLLWEMFNYGSQPYCGYSNQEVLEMIPRGQLLDCPDQCPAKMYSLMQECWTYQSNMRPTFSEILRKLQASRVTSTKQITSQLAHGLNQNLENIKSDGIVTYTPTRVSFSVGSRANGNTYTAGNNSLQSPPHYLSTYQKSSKQSHPTPNDANFISGQDDREFLQQPNGPDPSRQTSPHHSDENFSNKIIRGEQTQQNLENDFSRRYGSDSQSEKSTSSFGSEREKLEASSYQTRNKNEAEPDEHSKMVNKFSKIIQDHAAEEPHYQEPKPVSLQSMQKTNDVVPVDETLSPNLPLLSRNSRSVHADSSDISTNSFKATSCDSGLPVEDVEHPLDSKTPLLEHSQSQVVDIRKSS